MISPPTGKKTQLTPISPPTGERHREGVSSTTPKRPPHPTTIPPLDEEDFAHFDLSPTENDTTHPNLSPTGERTQLTPISPPPGERHREGARPSAVNRHPIASLHQTRRRPPHNDHNTFKVVRF